jgi:hypothetical protein
VSWDVFGSGPFVTLAALTSSEVVGLFSLEELVGGALEEEEGSASELVLRGGSDAVA